MLSSGRAGIAPLIPVFRSFARTRESRLCQIARTFNGQRLGPRVHGDERVETLLSFGSFLHRLFRGDERGGTTSFHFTSLHFTSLHPTSPASRYARNAPGWRATP